jgi:hypothetical protein
VDHALFHFLSQLKQQYKSWHSSSLMPVTMQFKSEFAGQETEAYQAQVFFDSQNAEAGFSPLSQLRAHFLEYGRLLLTFLMLYVQGRILMSQNYLLTCKLRMWDVAFFYMRVQIFLMRLVHGFPPGECWPRK